MQVIDKQLLYKYIVYRAGAIRFELKNISLWTYKDEQNVNRVIIYQNVILTMIAPAAEKAAHSMTSLHWWLQASNQRVLSSPVPFGSNAH